tara:strand:- start:3630 stop:3845 length:216 start_codon:yes stop_codon:yes gene_type:complete
MTKFIRELLELGSELDQATNGVQASMIINDAEILYRNHLIAFASFINRNELEGEEQITDFSIKKFIKHTNE